MVKPVSLWKIVVVLLVFPGCYMLYSLTPWSVKLFSQSDANYFIPFFSGLIVLHWSSFLVCRQLLISSGWTNEQVGFGFSKRDILKGVAIYFAIAISLFLLVEWVVMQVELDSEKLKQIGDFFPKTTAQRLLFILTALSAGFCEEFVYRGFGIRALESRKVNTWIALLITSLSFTFVHGIVVLERFPGYFVPGLIFGLLFIWRKTLALPMFIHALIDLTAILMVFQATF
ncbi:MAG: CPBP family intramembrane metalloprotease [Bacteroidetes bacterium]|nr:CPBP family intramembrane metalloprotease [Bacteroidota bacterium]